MGNNLRTLYLTFPLTQWNNYPLQVSSSLHFIIVFHHHYQLPQCEWCRFYSVSETVQGSNYLVTLMKSSIRIFNLQKPHAAAAYMMWIVGLDDMINKRQLKLFPNEIQQE